VPPRGHVGIEALDESYNGGLLAKVSAAERLVDRGQTAPAINELEDLVDQLEAKRDNQIPGATVDDLVACVDRIIDELSAGS
jgi:hypothetical protein